MPAHLPTIGKVKLTVSRKNPIGSIDKADLKRFIGWAGRNFDLPCLHDFLTAVPTAELVRSIFAWIDSGMLTLLFLLV